MTEGWYVRELLSSREIIKSNIISLDDSDVNADLEDSTYNDLLSVEFAIIALKKLGNFNKNENKIVDMYINSMPIFQIEETLKISKHTFNNLFDGICSRIAFYLGGYFTNEGYIEEFASKYKLNERQTIQLRTIMENK